MKLAFLLHPKGVRVPFDYSTLYNSARGLTGSEIAYFRFSESLSDMGHDVTMFSHFTTSGVKNNISYIKYDEWESFHHKQHWDAACAWTIADPLFLCKPSTFRFLNHQCNGFSTNLSGWESHVDIIAPLSNTHALKNQHETSLPKEKWRILYNGVDSHKFRPDSKKPHKIIWASSLDRGLHWLLEMFPAVKKAVPTAELHIFYDFHSIEYMADKYVPGMWFSTPVHDELGNRSRYILRAIEKMKDIGVHAHKSVSRDRIEQEMKESSILAYPLDPVYFTETFGVVVLEACASGTVPILCTDDAFGELWGPVAESVPPPFKNHKEEFRNKLIRLLNDDEYRSEISRRCVQYAHKFSWNTLSIGLERCIRTHGQEGLPAVNWGDQ